jgi:hypothetical protein
MSMSDTSVEVLKVDRDRKVCLSFKRKRDLMWVAKYGLKVDEV